MDRRHVLKTLLAICCVPFDAIAAAWNKAAFEATSSDLAVKQLGLNEVMPTQEIEIIAPERAENGAVVQVEVKSTLQQVEGVAIFVDGNPTPLISNFVMQAPTQARIVTRIKMAQTSPIQVIVKANGRYYSRSKLVTVLEDGCGGSDTEAKFESSMKMRARLVGDQTEVKVIIVHPMTTGRAKNSAGEIIPAFFIQTILAKLNGKPVLDMQCSTAIAKNPYLTFYLAGAKEGDRVAVNWLDNHGNTGASEVSVGL